MLAIIWLHFFVKNKSCYLKNSFDSPFVHEIPFMKMPDEKPVALKGIYIRRAYVREE